MIAFSFTGLSWIMALSSSNIVPEDVMVKFEQFLNDPRGAQIDIAVDKTVAAELGLEKVVCGKFNAKNGYGAFVGFKPFVFRSAAGGKLFYDGVVVEPDGSVRSVWKLMESDPKTKQELDAVDREAKLIFSEVSQSLALCEVS